MAEDFQPPVAEDTQQPMPEATSAAVSGVQQSPVAASDQVSTAPAPIEIKPLDESAKVPIYDISGDKPVRAEIGHEEVTEAVKSGYYSLPKNLRIPIIDPDGKHATIDASEAHEAFNDGYRYALPDEVKEEKYSGFGQGAKAFGEGLAEGVAGPIGTGLLKALGDEPKDMLGRREVRSGLHATGQMAGLVGGALTGTGEAALLDLAGSAGIKAMGLGTAGASSLAKVGGAAARAAIENMVFEGSDQVSRMILSDPSQTIDTVMPEIGLSGLIGGGIGGAIGAVSPLWKATVGDRAGQLIEDFKGRMKYHMETPDPVAAVTDELTNHYNGIRSAADEVYGSSGLKGKALAEAMPEMSPKITEQASTITKDLDNSLERLSKDPHAGMLEEKAAAYKSALTSEEPSKIFEATQDLKKQLQEWGKYNAKMSPLSERAFRDEAKGLAYKLRNALEDQEIWGKAGKVQGEVNKAFSEYLPSLKDFEKKFTVEIAGERTIDPGKIQTYMNTLDKKSSSVKKEMLGNFLEASEKYKKVIGDLHGSIGSESPISHSSLTAVKSTMDDLTHGGKLADMVVKKGLASLTGAGIGAGAAHALGLPPSIGALFGEHALPHIMGSVMPSVTKGFLAGVNSASGAKAAIDYAVTAIKGQKLLMDASKNVFKAGREVIPGRLIPTTKDNDRLDKQLSSLQKDPSSLANVGGDTGHYLPEHATAMGSTAANAVSYLNSLRPSQDKANPLDSKLPVNPVAKANYARALSIAEQPLVVLDRIQKGLVTSHDVIALKTMYPSLYDKISAQLTEHMTDTLNKGNSIPYQTRLGLSVFMGQALDSTMTAGSIISAQPQAPQQQAPQQGTNSKPPAASSVKGLSKLPGTYETPLQSRAQHQLK